jgi:hypothetical protein
MYCYRYATDQGKQADSANLHLSVVSPAQNAQLSRAPLPARSEHDREKLLDLGEFLTSTRPEVLPLQHRCRKAIVACLEPLPGLFRGQSRLLFFAGGCK